MPKDKNNFKENNRQNNLFEFEKTEAIRKEVNASFNFIIEGIRNLNKQSTIPFNNHVALQLLAAGFERLVKILLLLKEKHQNEKYPENNIFKKYDNGHGIKKMLKKLVEYAKNDEEIKEKLYLSSAVEYLWTDEKFNELIDILTEFSERHRYYYIDIILSDTSQASIDKNPFENFEVFIGKFSIDININNLTYKEEDALIIKSVIICIEKGARALSIFFTHGLGEIGKLYWGDFATFLLMKDEDLGSLKYLAPKFDAQKDYLPIKKSSFKYKKLLAFSKTKKVTEKDLKRWPFFLDCVKVINYKNYYYLVEIGGEVFALNGPAVGEFKIPLYIASKNLKPRQYSTELIEIAEK